ncbi:hypothetical protein AVEN_83796-1 [Araneus ventricosus]|uniref:Uncharacterized protein n=1 Tax=Araneus ventricosus TaxID=182803 RepID=A0A4Y2WRZ5_ARAVE|nr:hypothetical protein AVEN_23581-1 [Araneus ventricosus]GBO40088.1 hypothetical protein AVEN_83796-1 [Araneus ventricosus]
MDTTEDTNQNKTVFPDGALLSRDVSFGSGDSLSKTQLKIVSSAIERFCCLKESNSQYLRRLVALKQQVNSLPDNAVEKAFIYEVLLSNVNEYDGSTKILSLSSSKKLCQKLNELKISPLETNDSRFAKSEE